MNEDKINKVLKWAKSELTKYIQPCSTKGCKYSRIQPGDVMCKTPNPTPDSDDIQKENCENGHPFWNFYCMRFVRTAFNAPAEYPKAEDMYQALRQKGAISTCQDIPLGALVFWHWSDYGHIGIYAGDNKVIHTGTKSALKKRGIRESLLQDITDVLDGYNRNSQTSYLGWAYPPKNWLK
mgnify:CR=1 FL=1